MSSVFRENLNEQSPLLTSNRPALAALQPQTTLTSSAKAFSAPPTPQAARSAAPTTPPCPRPDPVLSSSTPAPQPDRDPKAATPNMTITNPTKANANKTPSTPTPRLPNSSTANPWGAPAGLPMRSPTADTLLIFRRAVGINSDLSATNKASPFSLESGHHHQKASGIYAEIQRARRSKDVAFAALNAVLWLAYFAQIVVGAGLAALGPGSGAHPEAITGLGVLNTVIAGFLALVKGQGLPERLRRDAGEFRRLQDWVEETEALLAAGVVGRDRKEVGGLVEMVFRRFNAAKASEENNRPEAYVSQGVEGDVPGSSTPPRGVDAGAAAVGVLRY